MKIARNERGFTLIIIGILAAIAIPVMSKQTDKAKVKRAVAELKTMKTIIDLQINDSVANPSGNAPAATAEDLGAILTANGVEEAALNDPWGTPYQYKVSGATYTLYTNGNPSTPADTIKVTESSNPSENQPVEEGGVAIAFTSVEE